MRARHELCWILLVPLPSSALLSRPQPHHHGTVCRQSYDLVPSSLVDPALQGGTQAKTSDQIMRSRLPEHASWASAASRFAGHVLQASHAPSQMLAAGSGHHRDPAPLLDLLPAALPKVVRPVAVLAGPDGRVAARAYRLEPRAWLLAVARHLAHRPKARQALGPLPRRRPAQAHVAAKRRIQRLAASHREALHSLQELRRERRRKPGQAFHRAWSLPCTGPAVSAGA
mmetsp:Transcript_52938/g.133764  ORF Transcript_52938/g.133764 Transcript_52938/m.133764 type:complete len:228 (-) Transcript_52938:291-974(-)